MGSFGQNLAKNQAEWYMNGSLFLGELVFVWVQFHIPSGTSLPEPNLSYPPSRNDYNNEKRKKETSL